MSFENLPDTIKELPLTDRSLAADVIDFLVGDSARADGCLGIMVCDERGRGVLPIVLSDVPHDADIKALATLFDLVLPLVVEQRGSVLVGRGRPRGGVPNDHDRAWHQCTIDACAAHGVALLGFYLATRDGVSALPMPLPAAS